MSVAFAVAVFTAAYLLIATERVNRVAVALGGAALMLALRLMSSEDAFHSERLGIDWDVIFLLLGMMVIVGVLKQTGLFDYLAIWSAKRARARPARILAALVLITAVASALLDNVTTVLLVAPVTVLVCERLGIPPVPFLIAEALASNIGGTATLIGDPPNIIIASQADLSYTDFLVHLAPLVVVLLAVFLLLLRPMFGRVLTYHPERAARLLALDERQAITDRPLLGRALVVLAVVTVAFALHGVLHYQPSVVALLGAGLLVLLARRDPGQFLREVEWPTLAFFMGLFVMVGALVKTGVVATLANAAAATTGGSLLVASGLLLWLSGALSAIVDNIPYVATMAPVTAELVQTMPDHHDPRVLWWSLALGADLGGNATAIGASANVVVLGLADRAGHPIRFLEFARYGTLVAVITMAISMLYLWLRYFLPG
ncbi:MAG TPA: ArsB/NhaD family transporter [Actinomycetota bacterium]|nr:ArsB/NhaD family transporter [Actinomycetota bacterium]